MVHRLRDDSPSRPKPFNSCPWRFSGSRTCRSPPGTPECTRASTASSRSRARGSSRAGRSRPRRARRAAAPRCWGAPLRGPGRDADEWGQPWIVAPRGRRCRGVRSDDRLSKRAGADIGSWSSNARTGRAAEVRSVTGGGTPRVPVHRQPAAARPSRVRPMRTAMPAIDTRPAIGDSSHRHAGNLLDVGYRREDGVIEAVRLAVELDCTGCLPSDRPVHRRNPPRTTRRPAPVAEHQVRRRST